MSKQITLNDVLNNNASQPIKDIYLYLKLALDKIKIHELKNNERIDEATIDCGAGGKIRR